jgi:hypothetical protein
MVAFPAGKEQEIPEVAALITNAGLVLVVKATSLPEREVTLHPRS